MIKAETTDWMLFSNPWNRHYKMTLQDIMQPPVRKTDENIWRATLLLINILKYKYLYLSTKRIV